MRLSEISTTDFLLYSDYELSYVCPNPSCRKIKCYDHCNHCGEPVLWRPKELDPEIAYRGPKPLNPPDGRTVHRCMRGGTKDGRFYKTEAVIPKKEEKKPWPTPPPGVHLGTTHLWVEGEFVPLYKCPLCSFQNIHKEVINHHIRFAFDKYHNSSNITI